MSNHIYGVAIGPTKPNDSSVLDIVLEYFKDIDRNDCEVKTFDEFNFISVKVSTYDASKKLSTYNKENGIKVTMVDIEKFDENAHKFWNLFPKLIKNKCVNFSRAPSRFKINFRYPPNISTLIFLSLMYSIQNNIEINSLNFSNCGITKEDGFYNTSNYFSKLKAVNLSGNSVSFSEPEFYFGSAKIITDNPNDEIQTSFRRVTVEEQDNNDSFITEQPQLVFQSLYEDSAITLDMFPSIEIDVDGFPTNSFICHFFRLMWDQILSCTNYYSEDAIFSIISHNSVSTSCFLDYDSNLLNDSPRHFIGNEIIIQVLQKIFPNGFKSSIMSMNCSIVNEYYFSVIIHGVFEGQEQIIYGFDRSFFIGFYDCNFRILNDNIFIKEPPIS